MHPLIFCLTLSLWLSMPVLAVDFSALAADYAGLPRVGRSVSEGNGASGAEGAQGAKAGVSAGKRAWDSYEKTIGVPLRKWAAEEIAPAKGGTVFYPFSGPDFVTVAQMFPEADRYVLAAIQPAGPVVDFGTVSASAAAGFRAKFQAEWAKFGALGFFRTIDLNENTASTVARLTSTPVMMAFAAALGFQVESVRPLRINAETAEFEPFDADANTKWSSVRLGLQKEGRSVTLDYICVDLSDQYLKPPAPELVWIQKMAKNPVLLKAASHLLPKPYFSACRSAIVEGAPLLIQDETGLEYPDLRRMGEVKLYGRFAGVLKLFNQDSQRELAAAYTAAGQTSPLPFAYSYQKSSDRRSLQVVRRVQKP